jgi:hypothetical protein
VLSEADQARLAARFGVYDHEWRYGACHLGQPRLAEGLLLYDDGTVLSLCAFEPEDPFRAVAWPRIAAALAAVWNRHHHRLIHIWGVFKPEPRLDLSRQLILANADDAANVHEGEFTIDLSDMAFADEAVCRKARRQIRNKKVEVVVTRSAPLDASQLRLIEHWRRTHELSGLSVSAGQAIAAFVRERQSYTATAMIEGRTVGFSVFSCPNTETAVNLMSFSDRSSGSRIDDALQWQSTQFARDLGCATFHLGYAGYDGLARFKRKWGARQTGPAYRAALYAVDHAWADFGRQYAFAWMTRLHLGSPS